MSDTEPAQAPREKVLSFMVGLCAQSNMRAAEGYLLELLAHLAFAQRDGQVQAS